MRVRKSKACFLVSSCFFSDLLFIFDTSWLFFFLSVRLAMWSLCCPRDAQKFINLKKPS